MAVKRGDTIRIWSLGVVREGKVDSAANYNGVHYIELTDPMYGAVYWRQDSDGGDFEILEVGPELMTLRRAVTEARNICKYNTEIIERVRVEYPDAELVLLHRGQCDLYYCTSYEIRAAACPPCQVFVFTLYGDDPRVNDSICVIGDEAAELDRFLAQSAKELAASRQ